MSFAPTRYLLNDEVVKAEKSGRKNLYWK